MDNFWKVAAIVATGLFGAIIVFDLASSSVTVPALSSLTGASTSTVGLLTGQAPPGYGRKAVA
jgi:hypothetical protein